MRKITFTKICAGLALFAPSQVLAALPDNVMGERALRLQCLILKGFSSRCH
jgi:hypothetical protein